MGTTGRGVQRPEGAPRAGARRPGGGYRAWPEGGRPSPPRGTSRPPAPGALTSASRPSGSRALLATGLAPQPPPHLPATPHPAAAPTHCACATGGSLEPDPAGWAVTQARRAEGGAPGGVCWARRRRRRGRRRARGVPRRGHGPSCFGSAREALRTWGPAGCGPSCRRRRLLSSPVRRPRVARARRVPQRPARPRPRLPPATHANTGPRSLCLSTQPWGLCWARVSSNPRPPTPFPGLSRGSGRRTERTPEPGDARRPCVLHCPGPSARTGWRRRGDGAGHRTRPQRPLHRREPRPPASPPAKLPRAAPHPLHPANCLAGLGQGSARCLSLGFRLGVPRHMAQARVGGKALPWQCRRPGSGDGAPERGG